MSENNLTQDPFLHMEATLYGYKIGFRPGSKEWFAFDYSDDGFTDYAKFQKFLETKLKTDFAGDMLGTKVLILQDFGRQGYNPAEIIGAKNPRSFIVKDETGYEVSIYREGLCLDTPKNRERVETLKAIHDKYLAAKDETEKCEERQYRLWDTEVEPAVKRVRKIAFEAVRY
jgi:hypothetical protein